jgi:hypothetical protein
MHARKEADFPVFIPQKKLPSARQSIPYPAIHVKGIALTGASSASVAANVDSYYFRPMRTISISKRVWLRSGSKRESKAA